MVWICLTPLHVILQLIKATLSRDRWSQARRWKPLAITCDNARRSSTGVPSDRRHRPVKRWWSGVRASSEGGKCEDQIWSVRTTEGPIIRSQSNFSIRYAGMPHGGRAMFPNVPIYKRWDKDQVEGLRWLLSGATAWTWVRWPWLPPCNLGYVGLVPIMY